jgi:hypothetical protein
VLVSITKGAAAAGTVSIVLDGEAFTFTVEAGDTVPQIVDKMHAMASAGWTKSKASNGVKFTRGATGLSENGYLDPSTTGVTATYETLVEGKDNDCDLSAIKKCTMFVVHSGSYRIFAAGNPDDSNALYYSEIGLPAYFKPGINKVYPAGGYGKITALLGSLSEALLVSFENGWYAWNGITPLEDATWKPLNLPYGCVCHRSIALTPYSFTFLAGDGVYNVSASILSGEAMLVYGKDLIKKVTENRVEKATRSISDRQKCRGVFFNNVYYLAYNTDGARNDRVLKYEWDTKSFTVKTGWNVNTWLSDPGSLYFASRNHLLKANAGYADFDVETGGAIPIPFNVVTKEYPLGNPLSMKNLKFLGLLFRQNDADLSSVKVTLHMGYEKLAIDWGAAADGLDLAESLIWGRAWGKVWGYRESIMKMIELNKLSNTFQVEMASANTDNPVTLVAIGFVYEETDLVAANLLKDEVLLK